MQSTVYVNIPDSLLQAGILDVVRTKAESLGYAISLRHTLTRRAGPTTESYKALEACSIYIAEVSDFSPSVCYEIGLAQGLGKAVILLVQRDSMVPLGTFLTPGVVIFYSQSDGFSSLHKNLKGSLEYVRPAISIEQSLAEQGKRTNIFISYSHRDNSYLERLLVHLTPLEVEEKLDLWVDTRIQAGDKWRKEIEQALVHASVVLVLVSADYLASEFIRINELPQMLHAAEERGVRVVPVVVRPCRFMRHEKLSTFQSFNPPNQPLSLLTDDERELVYDRLAGLIEKLAA